MKNLCAVQEMQEAWARSLSREDPLEEEMATHSSTLAWKLPWTGSLVGDHRGSCQESDTTELVQTHKHTVPFGDCKLVFYICESVSVL